MTRHADIDPIELNSKLSSEKVILVDVRNDDEVARGIIEGAIHLPMAVIPGIAQTLCEQGDTAMVIYCHSGIRSAQAAAYLAQLGRENVYNLRGGVLAWANAGFTFSAKTE